MLCQCPRNGDVKHLRSPKDLLTRKERTAAGKALRDRCPRGSNAVWKAPRNRRDPVDLLVQSRKDRIPNLIPIRYGRMMQSPFAFYRGAAAIMAADLALMPTSGIRVQACGDCHLMNFGGFGTPERRIIFDISDFDETLPAPWEWDLKRLAVSFVIAGRNNGFKEAESRKAALRCIQSYHEHMHCYAEIGALEMWYQRMDNMVACIKSRKWRKIVQKQIAKAATRTAAEYDFPKLASVKNGKVRIKDNPPLIFHQRGVGTAEYDRLVKDAFRCYRETLPDDLKTLLDRYEVKDVAVKVVGIGSVGTRCAILLIMTGDGEPLFLQVKEAHESVLEPYAGKSVYSNDGQRVVVGQRLMQAASDMFLGWTEQLGRHFYVRQLRDIKIEPLVEIFDSRALADYGEWCGWALARAHAKSGDAAMMSGYLGNSSRFDDAVLNFAMAYADQNERDYQAFLEAIRGGKIEVRRE
jgi:uncharacterized protein (DUF2252 family)